MSRIIDDKIFDNKEALKTLAKLIRKQVENTDVKKEYIAKMLGVDPSRISQMLGSVPSNDESMYKKILSICGYPPSLFDKLKEQAIREHFRIGGEPDIDVALSTKYRGNPEALEEAKRMLAMVDKLYKK